MRAKCEIVLVDGGSNDATIALAANYVDKIIRSARGRAVQMNTGAKAVTGDVLIFLHADTFLPTNALEAIESAIHGGKSWGRFSIRLDGEHFMFRVIAFMMNWRSRLTGIATGDQVIFVTKQAFDQVGHYPEIALMEDIALSKALLKINRPCCLTEQVVSSSRRWLEHGILKTILLMWVLRALFFFKVDPEVLAGIYSRGCVWKR